MYRREMCTGKVGVKARRDGLAARREEQRTKILQNRRNLTSDSSEKKTLVPKPKESATERRARLDQYRQMKTLRESELRSERLRTPAFRVGPATAREQTTPSTSRKMLNFDFKKSSEGENLPDTKTPASRRAFRFAAGPTSSKMNPGTARVVVTGSRTTVKRSPQGGSTPKKGAPQRSETPKTAPKTPGATLKSETAPATTSRRQPTPNNGARAPMPLKTTSSRSTPSKGGPNSTSKKPKPREEPSTSSNKVVDSSKSMRTPRIAAGFRQASTKTPTADGTGTKSTPSKASSTPLKSIGPKRNSVKDKATPKQTPLSSRTRSNLSKRKNEKNHARNDVKQKKANFSPKEIPTTSLERTQSSDNLSRPTPSKSAKKLGLAIRGRSPQITASLEQTQSSSNLSRASALKSVAKAEASASKNKTPHNPTSLKRTQSSTNLWRPSPLKSVAKPGPTAPKTATPQKSASMKRTQSSTNLWRPSPLKSVAKPGPTASKTATPQNSASMKRTQSSTNLSRPSPLKSVAKPGPTASKTATPQNSASMKRTQSSTNLSRPSPLKSLAKPGAPAARHKTPQMKLQRSTSASTLTRNAPTSSLAGSKTRLDLSKKFAGDPRCEGDTSKREVLQRQEPNLDPNLAVSSVPKTTTMSRIQVALLKKQVKAVVQKKIPLRDVENDRKWANLMALIEAKKNL